MAEPKADDVEATINPTIDGTRYVRPVPDAQQSIDQELRDEYDWDVTIIRSGETTLS